MCAGCESTNSPENMACYIPCDSTLSEILIFFINASLIHHDIDVMRCKCSFSLSRDALSTWWLIVQCVMCTQSLVSSSDFRSQNSSFSSIFKNFSTANARKIKRPSALIMRKFWKIEAFVWISILHYKLSFQV